MLWTWICSYECVCVCVYDCVHVSVYVCLHTVDVRQGLCGSVYTSPSGWPSQGYLWTISNWFPTKFVVLRPRLNICMQPKCMRTWQSPKHKDPEHKQRAASDDAMISTGQRYRRGRVSRELCVSVWPTHLFVVREVCAALERYRCPGGVLIYLSLRLDLLEDTTATHWEVHNSVELSSVRLGS